MLEFLKPLPLISLHIDLHFAEFSTLSFDDVNVDDVTVASDMFTKRMETLRVTSMFVSRMTVATKLLKCVYRIYLSTMKFLSVEKRSRSPSYL